jgi:hypothetical protein
MNNYNKYLLLILFLFFHSIIHSQFLPGSRRISLAHSDIALNNDIFAIFNNPAGLSLLNERQIGFYHSPAPFGVKELSNSFITYIQPTNIGNFCVGGMYYGFDLYNESLINVAYANELYKDFFVGVTNSIKIINIEGYGSGSKFNLILGGIYKISQKLSVGFSIHNFLRFQLIEDYFEFRYQTGIAYFPYKNTSINFSISKQFDFPFAIHFGVEYPLIDYLFLRIGAQNEPNLYSGGLGIHYSNFEINYSVAAHLELSLTHQFDLLISF